MKTGCAKNCARIMEKYGESIAREDVFPILGKIQDAVGCIPRSSIEDICRKSGFSVTQIYGAVTAYPEFIIKED